MKPAPEAMYRVLVRVVTVDAKQVTVVVPGWSLQKKISLPTDSLPAELVEQLRVGKRVHARVNIGTKKKTNLHFADWEFI